LTEEEDRRATLTYLNEWSAFGHIVPDHGHVLDQGLGGIIADCEARKGALPGTSEAEERQRDFYDSVIITRVAVVEYAGRLAELASSMQGRFPDGDPLRENLAGIADRLRRVPRDRPETLLEAAQCLLLMHSMLHLTGEIVPLGRVDQLLGPFYA